MRILSKMLTKKPETDLPARDFNLEEEARMPEADDSGRVNPSRVVRSRPLDASPDQPVVAKGEEPEVAGSGWEDGAWDDEDWDDDEDWGEEDDDPAQRRLTEDKKQLVSEIRDAMISVSHVRPESVDPAKANAAAVPQDDADDWSDDDEFGRKALARSEMGAPHDEDRILEKTDRAMTEEGTSRRRSAMAHLKAAAAATKADRVLRHVASQDPSADPEEQSPYRDDLAKVVRPHSTSRPISRVVSRVDAKSPIWDQGEGDEDAALFAAAEDGSEDISDSVSDELAAAEAERIARAPADLSEEDFASEAPSARVITKSAFPASPFAQDDAEDLTDAGSALEDIGADDFEDDFEEEFEDVVADTFEEEDDLAPRPSRAVTEAVAFANAADDEEDETPPETEVRKKIWEMAEEVAAEVGQSDAQMTMTPAEAAEQAANQSAMGAPGHLAMSDASEDGEDFVDLATAVSGRAGRSAGRVKTRLLGFQALDEPAKDVFEEAKESQLAAPTLFPAGWIVVIEGPGRGSCFTLHVGVSQIGRGEDQAVRLDFGDSSISRNNHAAVAYDDEQGKFFLGHGGKSNLVRLNGMPVLSTEELSAGDEIRIGETTLKFVSLCGENFTWASSGETAAE